MIIFWESQWRKESTERRGEERNQEKWASNNRKRKQIDEQANNRVGLRSPFLTALHQGPGDAWTDWRVDKSSRSRRWLLSERLELGELGGLVTVQRFSLVPVDGLTGVVRSRFFPNGYLGHWIVGLSSEPRTTGTQKLN